MRRRLRLLLIAMKNQRQTVVETIWEAQDELEEDLEEAGYQNQLVTQIRAEAEAIFLDFEKEGILMDKRLNSELTPHRVKFIEKLITDLCTDCEFPIAWAMEKYKNEKEIKKLQIGNNMMKLMNKIWRQEIYKEANWKVKDETEKYSWENLNAAMDECELDYHKLVPWFVDTYNMTIDGLWPRTKEGKDSKEDENQNSCCSK